MKVAARAEGWDDPKAVTLAKRLIVPRFPRRPGRDGASAFFLPIPIAIKLQSPQNPPKNGRMLKVQEFLP